MNIYENYEQIRNLKFEDFKPNETTWNQLISMIYVMKNKINELEKGIDYEAPNF